MQTLFSDSKQAASRTNDAKKFSVYELRYRGGSTLVEKLTLTNPLGGLPYLKKAELVIERTFLLLDSTYASRSDIERICFTGRAFHGAGFLLVPMVRGALTGIAFSVIFLLFHRASGSISALQLLFLTAFFTLYFLICAVPKTTLGTFGVVVINTAKWKWEFSVRMRNAEALLDALRQSGCEVEVRSRGESETQSAAGYRRSADEAPASGAAAESVIADAGSRSNLIGRRRP